LTPREARAGPAAPGRPARDLTAPVKIYLQVVVQIHRNEHEFPLMIPFGSDVYIALAVVARRCAARESGPCAEKHTRTVPY